MAQTYTSLGTALVAAGSGAATAVPQNAGPSPIVTVNATLVTTGGVVSIDGRNATAQGVTGASTFTDWRELYRVTVAANAVYAVPLSALSSNAVTPDQIRLTCVSRTDGTFAGQIVTGKV